MSMVLHEELSEVLGLLVERYRERVPDVGKVLRAMLAERMIECEDEVENDHIAFRTLGVPHLGVRSLEKIFLHFGYTRRDYYFFPEKKLNAWWYAPPVEGLPRIFISELRVEDLSARSQAIIEFYTRGVTKDPVDVLDLSDLSAIDRYLHSSSWTIPTLTDYEWLLRESEYAAWVIYNRYYLNHFTLAVHRLGGGYHTLEAFNAFLRWHGIVLNDSGGVIKQSPDGLLLQSSTVAEMVEAVFADGERKMIPGSYVEFAERRVLPEFQGLEFGEIRGVHRREGFEAGNADKIFESTYGEQVGRR